MVVATENRVRDALAGVEDPEVPVTLVDLGVIRDIQVSSRTVRVVLRPTRLACPARDEMARRVRRAVLSVDGHLDVDVVWEMATWRGDDVSSRGRQVLLQVGYADPQSPSSTCPYCGSADVRPEGAFGGAVCKVPFSCEACGSVYDALKGSQAATGGRTRV